MLPIDISLLSGVLHKKFHPIINYVNDQSMEHLIPNPIIDCKIVADSRHYMYHDQGLKVEVLDIDIWHTKIVNKAH